MSNTITPTVFYRTLNVEGLEIVYREAGPRDAPTVLLLHGFPSSSHMFRRHGLLTRPTPGGPVPAVSLFPNGAPRRKVGCVVLCVVTLASLPVSEQFVRCHSGTGEG